MILTIDNLDGKGAVDYSAALCPDGPLKIKRVLNAPSLASGLLDVGDARLSVPVRRARVIATAASGAVLFTGYLATEPEAVYAGAGFAGFQLPTTRCRYQGGSASSESLLIL